MSNGVVKSNPEFDFKKYGIRQEDDNSKKSESISQEDLQRLTQLPDKLKNTNPKTLSNIDCLSLHAERPESLWYFVGPGNVAMLFGPPDSKKSYMLLDLCISIAEGKGSYLGWDLKCRHQRSLYLSYEDNAGDLGERFKCMGKTVQIENLYIQTIDIIKPLDAIKNLKKTIMEIGGVDLVVIDPFRQILQGKTIMDESQVTKVLELCQETAAKTNAAIVVIGHSTKSECTRWDKNSLKGPIEQAAGLRLIMMLQDDYFGIVKGNRVPDSEKEIAHELQWIENKFIWKRTGAQLYQSELNEVQSTVKRAYEIEWNLVFNGQEEMKRVEIVEAVKHRYKNISDRTIDTYIGIDLKQSKYGYYRHKNGVNDG